MATMSKKFTIVNASSARDDKGRTFNKMSFDFFPPKLSHQRLKEEFSRYLTLSLENTEVCFSPGISLTQPQNLANGPGKWPTYLTLFLSPSLSALSLSLSISHSCSCGPANPKGSFHPIQRGAAGPFEQSRPICSAVLLADGQLATTSLGPPLASPVILSAPLKCHPH